MSFKNCSKCWRRLPVEAFRAGKTRDGYNAWCTDCTVYATHHLTYGEVQRMLHRQMHKCPICHVTLGEKFHIDHDHACCPGTYSCGKCVRGLLCVSCNVGLVRVLENSSPELVRSAQSYIVSHRVSFVDLLRGI